MSLIPLGFWAASGGGAAGDFVLLETTTLTSSASSVTFSGLDAYSDYKHLQIRMVGRAATFDGVAKIKLNNDSGANYAFHRLIGNGSTVASSASTGQSFIWSSIVADTANAFTAEVLDILDYANTSKNTTLRLLGGLAISGGQVQLNSGLWNNTAAVTSVTYESYSSWQIGSRFSLYGVK